jgi:RHS repeat-associated protein
MVMKARYTTVNGEVIAEKRGGVRSLYVPDPLGSTVALLDNTQAQTDTFAYWPYGEIRTRTGTTATPLQFVGTQGYYKDSSSRTYVRARTLDTQKGRWLTQDPTGFGDGDVNLYRYVENRSVTNIDPSGLAWYGRYCGPQMRDPHLRGIDPLDSCCKDHDDCWDRCIPKCKVTNQLDYQCCRICTLILCACASLANCNNWIDPKKKAECLIALWLVRLYACSAGAIKAPWEVGGREISRPPQSLGDCFFS